MRGLELEACFRGLTTCLSSLGGCLWVIVGRRCVRGCCEHVSGGGCMFQGREPVHGGHGSMFYGPGTRLGVLEVC